VINAFGAKGLDFDVENGLPVSDALQRTAANHMRNQAIHNLQHQNSGLQISFTLGVFPTGLPQAQLNVLIDAKNSGVGISVVNIMAMDYGSCGQNMGQDAINAAEATQDQLAANGISASVGVTPMVGTNDTSCEYFSTTDAHNLLNYAQSNSYITRLAYWSQESDSASYHNAYVSIFKSFH
jgi:chitinase